jgi:hypothetical protein
VENSPVQEGQENQKEEQEGGFRLWW